MALLEGGRLMAKGPTENVLDGENLSAIFGVAVSVERLPSGRKICVPEP